MFEDIMEKSLENYGQFVLANGTHQKMLFILDESVCLEIHFQ